jgi:hypothetical protein
MKRYYKRIYQFGMVVLIILGLVFSIFGASTPSKAEIDLQQKLAVSYEKLIVS